MNRTILLPTFEAPVDGPSRGEIEVSLTTDESRGHLRLSLQGSLWTLRRKRDPWCGGQCHDEIAEAYPDVPLVIRIVEVWNRWHLNDMRAGSPRQEAALNKKFGIPRRYEYRGSGRADAYTQTCEYLRSIGLYEDDRHPPVVEGPSGYRYGTAWLYEPLPQAIVDEVVAWPNEVRR